MVEGRSGAVQMQGYGRRVFTWGLLSSQFLQELTGLGMVHLVGVLEEIDDTVTVTKLVIIPEGIKEA